MKKIIKISVILSLLLLTLVVAVSCSSKDAYGKISDEGYNVSVKFDIGKGMFAGRNELVLVDVFNLDNEKTGADGNKEISLISPDSSLRGGEKLDMTYNGHYFVGWYQERTVRKDANGNFLDEYGNVCEEKDAAYEYAKKWDFETDKLVIDPDGDYDPEEPELTLYAAWVPFSKFEFYSENSSGEFELIKFDEDKTFVESSSLQIPDWSESTGSLTKTNFPTLQNKTFDGAYLDEACTIPVKNGEELLADINEEKGILNSPVRKIYTKWLDGNHYRIYNAKAFEKVEHNDAICVVYNDLNFKNVDWKNTVFAKETFNGKIYGNDGATYKFSNIKASYVAPKDADASSVKAHGLFRELGDKAEIKNIVFENVTYTIGTKLYSVGDKTTPSYAFGLLAGKVDDTAVIENVTVIGENKILLDPTSVINAGTLVVDIDINLLFGIGEREMDFSNITCELSAQSDVLVISVNKLSGAVIVDIAE